MNLLDEEGARRVFEMTKTQFMHDVLKYLCQVLVSLRDKDLEPVLPQLSLYRSQPCGLGSENRVRLWVGFGLGWGWRWVGTSVGRVQPTRATGGSAGT